MNITRKSAGDQVQNKNGARRLQGEGGGAGLYFGGEGNVKKTGIQREAESSEEE